jgi:hypothetical protein
MGSFDAIPLEIERLRLWVFGFILVVALSATMGLVLADIQTDAAVFRVSETGADGSVRVTIEQSTGSGFERVRRTTVTDEQTVWMTTEPGWYRVTIADDSGACEYHVGIQRVDSGLVARAPLDSSRECPAHFDVNIVQKTNWTFLSPSL